jgi:hypothetical protein
MHVGWFSLTCNTCRGCSHIDVVVRINACGFNVLLPAILVEAGQDVEVVVQINACGLMSSYLRYLLRLLTTSSEKQSMWLDVLLPTIFVEAVHDIDVVVQINAPISSQNQKAEHIGL